MSQTEKQERRPNAAEINQLSTIAAQQKEITNQETSLRYNKGSMLTTVMSQAWQECGIDPRNPPVVNQIFLKEQQLIIIDLSGHTGGSDE